MTYCAAWKKSDKVFLIADSAISSFNNKIDIEYSSFGEKQGLYDSYYVNESALKIIKINNKMAICYSGDKKTAEEAIEYIKIFIEDLSIDQMLENLKLNFKDGEQKFELIIVYYENGNKIYYFKGKEYFVVEKFIDIGSGKDIGGLSEKLKKFIYDNEKLPNETDSHLAGVITYIQSISMKNNFYNFGVGGAFFGICMDEELTWCKDLHYYIYEENLNEFNYVSIVSRYDGIYSASGFNNSIRYFYNQGTNSEILSNTYIQEKIRKILINSIPDYFVFYSTLYNNIYILNIEKFSHTSIFRMWMRRQGDKTKLAFVFNPDFVDRLLSNKNNMSMYPDFFNVPYIRENFITRENFISNGIISNQIDDINDTFDYDLRQYKVNFNCKNFEIIHSTISEFKNLIILDYNYFCEIVSEKYEIYKNSGITMEVLEFSKVIETYLPDIASDDFNDYGLYVVKNSVDNVLIDGFSMDDWFKAYGNCRFIIDLNNNYKTELKGIVFEAIKNYYFDESYFHLDKIIICCEDKGVNEVLSLVPLVNFEEESPNILLIRNMNALTVMNGRFKYIVIDYAVGYMFRLNINQIGILESGFIVDINDIQ